MPPEDLREIFEQSRPIAVLCGAYSYLSAGDERGGYTSPIYGRLSGSQALLGDECPNAPERAYARRIRIGGASKTFRLDHARVTECR